jgi:lipopolysaccharide export system permease protein
MLFSAFIRAYAICMVATLSLYIIVDLFTNIDDFFQHGKNGFEIAIHILTYYGYRTIQYYDRLSEALSLLAAMFTVAWTQRNNELIPMLSAGVSTHRFLKPILVGAFLMQIVGVANQEYLIPYIAPALVTDRNDPEGTKDLVVQGCYDPSGVHIDGIRAFRREQVVESFNVTLPVGPHSEMKHLSADLAHYIPPDPRVEDSGGWMMTGTSPAELQEGTYDPEIIAMKDPGRFFLHVREATFDRVTQGQKTQAFSATSNLYRLMQRSDAGRMNELAVTFHMRLTRPIVGMLLVIMGLSIILRDQTRHIFISAGLCLVMCVLFFAVVFGGKFLGTADYISPALAAWLPVIIFGPFAISFYDAIHT